MPPADNQRDRDDSLKELQGKADACRRCAMSETRTNVVFGSGSPASRLMLVGEAPGYHEDLQGVPFVGQAGKLLEELLGRASLDRSEVYIANVLKCRPPGNRDPQTEEIDNCCGFLKQQISIIGPAVICTLGNFATRLLSGLPDGITRVHGNPRPLPEAWGKAVLFPVFHPAAALYTPANLEALKQDFDRLAELLGSGGKRQPGTRNGDNSPGPHPLGAEAGNPDTPEQLGLF